jgi:hypothetical protein
MVTNDRRMQTVAGRAQLDLPEDLEDCSAALFRERAFAAKNMPRSGDLRRRHVLTKMGCTPEYRQQRCGMRVL